MPVNAWEFPTEIFSNKTFEKLGRENVSFVRVPLRERHTEQHTNPPRQVDPVSSHHRLAFCSGQGGPHKGKFMQLGQGDSQYYTALIRAALIENTSDVSWCVCVVRRGWGGVERM